MYIYSIFSKGFGPLLWGLILGSCLGFPLTSVQAQVYEGDLTLSTQAQVDAFTYTEVRGNLTIRGADIVDLNPLHNLTFIGGDLIISYNKALTNLEGLNRLQTVSGQLVIGHNEALINIDGLAGIQMIGFQLKIEYNDSLTNVDGLTGLKTLKNSSVTIHVNKALTNIDGLHGIKTIGGFLLISDNYKLNNIDGLKSIQSIGSGINISANHILRSLDGLNRIQSIGGDLKIHYNQTLTSLVGLTRLQTIKGSLIISYNYDLTSIEELQGVQILGSNLQIEHNDALPNIGGLQGIQTIGGYMTVKENYALTNLDGLSTLQSVGGYIMIEENGVLTNFDGLSTLQSVGGYFKINDNDALTNIDGLSTLQTVGEDFEITENNVLVNIDGLMALQMVYGRVYITNNNSLLNVDGLRNLQMVKKEIGIYRNPQLGDFCGLYPVLKEGKIGWYFSSRSNLNNVSDEDILNNSTCAAQFACSLSIAEIIQQDESCIGAHDGQLLVYDEGEGGGGAFPEYSKDGGLSWQPNGLFANLSPGDYQIVVRFPNMPSCSTAIQTKTIQAGTNPRPTLTATTTKSNCLGDTDGTITLTANRPAGSHLFYSLNDEPFLAGGPTYTYIHQGAGDHRVIVKDLNDCISEVLEVRLKAHERPTFKALAKQDATGELTEDGVLHIEPLTSGFAPYTYSLDDGATYLDDPDLTFGADFGGLNPGEYDIRIRDKNGCISEHRHITVNDLSQCTTRTALANKYNFVYSGNTEAAYVCEGNLFQQKYTVSNLADGERFRLDWVIEETFGEVNEHSTFNEMIPTPDAIGGSQGPYSTGGNYIFDAGGGILGMEDYAKHNDTMHFTLTPVIILPDGQECHGNPVDEYAYVYPGGRIRLQNAKQPGQTIVIASGDAPNGTFEAIPATQLIGLPLIYNIDIAPTQGITELTDGFGSTESDLTTTYGQDEYKLYGLTNTTAEPVKVTVNVTPVVDQWTSSVDIHCEGESQSIDIWVLPGS